MAWVLADHMHRATKTQVPVDEEAYFVDVRALTKERWYAQAA